MKKIILKAFGMFLAAGILLFSLPTNAQQDIAQIACDALEFSMISSESSDLITKDLDLSLTDFLVQYPDVTLNWMSSDPSVLTISEGRGIITRPTENKSVTLKVTVYGGSSSASKEFQLTVLKRHTTVLLDENFDHVEKNKSIEQTVLADKGFDIRAKGSESEYLASVVNDPEQGESANSVLCSHRILGNNDSNQQTRISMASSDAGYMYKIKMRLKIDNGSNRDDVFIAVNGINSNQETKTAIMLRAVGSKLAFTQDGTESKYRITSINTADWFTLDLTINLQTSQYLIKCNEGESNETISDWIYFPAAGISFSKLTEICMNPFRRCTDYKLYADDIKILTETSDTISGGMLAVRNGNKAAVRYSYNNGLDAVQIFDNIIPNTGLYENSMAIGEVGLIDADEGNSFNLDGSNGLKLHQAPVFSINSDVIGGGKGASVCVLATSSLHGLNVRDLGKVYRDENNVKWTLMSVPDEDHLLFISENQGSTYQYSFLREITGILQNDNEVIIVEAQQPDHELLPTTKRDSLNIFVISNGERTLLENHESLLGDSVEIVEKYSVLNPATLAEGLTNGRPDEGYCYVPEPEGEALANISLVYTFDENGVCMVKAAHEVLIDTALFSEFGYQALRMDEGVAGIASVSPNRCSVGYDGKVYTSVILPVLDAEEREVIGTNGQFTLLGASDLPKSSLPYFIPVNAFPEATSDMTVNVVTACQLQESADSGICEFEYLNETYLYFDFKAQKLFEYPMPQDGKDVIVISKSDGVSLQEGAESITISAESDSDYLTLKLGHEQTDVDLARLFLEQKGESLGINLQDADYLAAPQQILTDFVAEIKGKAPQSPADIYNAFMRVQAVSAFSGLKVTEADAKLKKYGAAVGIPLESYKKDCTNYGEIEIGKAFADVNFSTPDEILACYNSRIKALSENSKRDGSQSSGSPSASRGSSVNIKTKNEPVTPEHNTERKGFTDLPSSHWAADYIIKLAEMNIVSGYEDGSFCPEALVTREQFVKMLISALDLLKPDAVNAFSDVSLGSWSEPYISSAAAQNIVSGYDSENFAPKDNITREDVVVIVKRALEKAGVTLKPITTSIDFNDTAEISPYASESVLQMAGMGLINGVEDGRFAPKDYLTRAQGAKIIYIACTIQ